MAREGPGKVGSLAFRASGIQPRPRSHSHDRDTRPPAPPRNGVDVPTLFATLDAVKASPEIADFQFRARNTWISGTHNRTTIQGFYGAGQEDTSRTEPFVYDADHPAVLVGTNKGPTPVEFLLHAIAACLTAGLANIAAARGVTLHRVESTVEGDIDLLGILGLSPEVRNGYRQIRVGFVVDGDATPERARRARRAVPQAVRRLRRAHQRHRRGHRRRRRLTPSRRSGWPGPTPVRPADPLCHWKESSMSRIPVVVIGAGQAGLAVSHLLTDSGVDTSCSSAAASPNAGRPSRGSPCACSPRTGSAGCRASGTPARTRTDS